VSAHLKVTVHKLTPRDYRAVKKIEKIIVDEYLQYLKRTGEQDSVDRWITPGYFNHYVKTKTSFVSKANEKIVGFVLTQPISHVHSIRSEIWLEYIGVLPSFRKKGIGSRLMAKVIDYAKSNDVAFLYTTLNPNNTESARLLEKHGFEIKDWKEASRKLKESEVSPMRARSTPFQSLKE
jgi:ribosomal protein S18 acetylase RimI-like enzyme